MNNRWLSLIILCLGDLMIVLDTTIVNVALPSIRLDLGFSETSLVWVVNAYILAFSGFLLLGGRLGDLFGHRKVFLAGLVLFTGASLLCGIAESQWFLVTARAVQGLGGAIVSAIAFSLILNLFPEGPDRAKAMGYFGFIAAGGGAIGVFLGGLLTGAFDWHWVFLVNVPIGILVFILCLLYIPKSQRLPNAPRLDTTGAVTVTGALIMIVYAIINGNQAGWLSVETLSILGAGIALFCFFLFIESRISAPLVPLSIFSKQNVAVTSMVGILWSAAMFAWFFLSALYLQLVLGYTPLQVGLAFLPANLIMAAFSFDLSAKTVGRFGIKGPLTVGMVLVALGLFLFAFAPLGGNFALSVLPAMLLLGLGAGLAFNPVLLAGTNGIPEEESGLASGVLNTAFMMGGSLGLAILASLAALRSALLISQGTEQLTALLSGYHLSFLLGGIAALIAAACAWFLIRITKTNSV